MFLFELKKSMIDFIKKYLYIFPGDRVVFIILINIIIQVKLAITPKMLTTFIRYLLINSIPEIYLQFSYKDIEDSFIFFRNLNYQILLNMN
jgi:hypothetical protein